MVNGLGRHVEELKIGEKAFRAWHGHGHLSACTKCDAEQAKRDRETAAKARPKP